MKTCHEFRMLFEVYILYLTSGASWFWEFMYVYDSINAVYVRLCTLMTVVMSFTLLDSHKPNSAQNIISPFQGG